MAVSHANAQEIRRNAVGVFKRRRWAPAPTSGNAEHFLRAAARASKRRVVFLARLWDSAIR
jgi:hypothetical protein